MSAEPEPPVTRSAVPNAAGNLQTTGPFAGGAVGAAEAPTIGVLSLPGMPQLGRYQVLGQVGRGGMGMVIRVHDPDMGRDLALKILLDRPAHRPDDVHRDVTRRFFEEARITGQLQHPGIVPIHECGQLPDGRPYFAMKLIKGRTLSELLKDRPNPADDLPRFVKVFEQVCQTLAYAHSRHVIHRDLKPLNVMVGAFGEVQVMDWGLAKVLGAKGHVSGIQDERSDDSSLLPPVVTEIRTHPTPQPGAATEGGWGTPAYMPPEQARGDVDKVDERCDVFSLGAILCEILTGEPPHRASNQEEIKLRAMLGEMEPCFGRLDKCSADIELIGIAKRCLAPQQADRPRDAGAVAEAVTAYLAGVQEKLHKAEVERAAAEARTAEERKRRRVRLGLAAAVLALVTFGASVGLWWWHQHSDMLRDVELALAEAAGHREAGRWPDVQRALERAEGRLGRTGAGELRERVRQRRADADLVTELDEIHLRQADLRRWHFDIRGADPLYAAAFQKHGFDLAAENVAAIAALVRASEIREELLAALDNWAHAKAEGDGARRKLRAIADAADDSDWRRAFRDAVDRNDGQKLNDLGAQADALKQPATILALFGMALRDANLGGEAVSFLRLARERHPADFWINHQLAFLLQHLRSPRIPEAVGYYRAAVAVRPGSPGARLNLGSALQSLGDYDAAIVEYRAALAINPRYVNAHINLGNALDDKGDTDAAVAEYRQVLAIDPRNADAYSNLGVAFARKGDKDSAMSAYAKAIELDPDDASHHVALGAFLCDDCRDYSAAIACFRQALALDPKHARAQRNLGIALSFKGDREGTLAAFRRAVALNPDDSENHSRLGDALDNLGDSAGALAAYHRALTLNPRNADAYDNLGVALAKKGDMDAALSAYRLAILFDPKKAHPHTGVGTILAQKGDLDGAIAELRQAIALDPKRARAHKSLAKALLGKGDMDGAIAALRQAIAMDSKDASALNDLGILLCDKKRDFDGAIAVFQQSIALDAKDTTVYHNLSIALNGKGDFDGAVAVLRRIIALNPKDVTALNNLGTLLCNEKHDYDGAIAAFQQCIALRANDAGVQKNLATALSSKGDFEGAVVALRRAIELNPTDAQACRNLGVNLQGAGDVDGAIAAVQKALKLNPKLPHAHNTLGAFFCDDKRDYPEAIAAFRQALILDPNDGSAYGNLGNALRLSGDFAAALEAYNKAIELAKKRNERRDHLAAAVQEAKYYLELDAKFPAILEGQVQARNANEQIAFAVLCRRKGYPAAAARFYAEAFAAEKKLEARYRFDAACCASLGGSEPAMKGPNPSDAERIALRKQAVSWLKDEIAAKSEQMESAKPDQHLLVSRTLRRWQQDRDLAGLRDADALAKLPADEQEACKTLWAGVEALLLKAQVK